MGSITKFASRTFGWIWRAVPSTIWAALAYIALIPGDTGAPMFTLPTLTGSGIPITASALVVFAAFSALALEMYRATDVQGNVANYILSVGMAIGALVLWIGFPTFGTAAFGAVFMATVVDACLSFIIAQRVARRDLGFHPGYMGNNN